MKKIRLIAILLLISSLSIGQNSVEIDSLLNVLKSQSVDTNYVKTLNKICNRMMFSNAKKSLEYGEKALTIAESLKWDKGIGLSYLAIGDAYENDGNNTASLEYRLKELKVWESLNSKSRICVVLSKIGASYDMLGDKLKAMKYYILSTTIAEEIGNSKIILNNQNNMAFLYEDQLDFAKALQCYSKALKIAEENKYDHSIAIVRNNIGQINVRQGNFSQAILQYSIAVEIENKLGYKRNEAMMLSNIGSAYSSQADSAEKVGNITLKVKLLSKAREYFIKALGVAEEIEDDAIIAGSYCYIGGLDLNERRYKEAEENLQKALSLAVKSNSLDQIKNAHKSLYDLYKATHIPEKALEHYERLTAIKDSMTTIENRQAVSELQVRYETAKKENENMALIQENRIQALSIINNRYLLGGLLALFLFSLIFGFLLLRQNRLKSQRQAIQYEQKLLRAQMNPHFMFNSLASIESFIYEHQPKEAGVYLSRFAKLMRLILENSAEEYITLEKEVETLNYYLSLQKLRLEDNFSYQIEVDEKINKEEIHLPPMLTQPFIENAIEHGFRGSKESGKIMVKFAVVENELQVQVIDNGIGIVQAQLQKDLHRSHKSMAIQITLERLKFLNRSQEKKLTFQVVDISSENDGQTGTKIVFGIPLELKTT